MSIIGMNFTKITVERKNAATKKINVQNNLGINGVESTQLSVANAASQPLKFKFFFHCEFQPEVGMINLDGEVIALIAKKEAESILKEWKEHKRVPAAHATVVLNAALAKAQIMALMLSKEVSLPLPVQLPKVVPNTPTAVVGAKPAKK